LKLKDRLGETNRSEKPLYTHARHTEVTLLGGGGNSIHAKIDLIIKKKTGDKLAKTHEGSPKPEGIFLGTLPRSSESSDERGLIKLEKRFYGKEQQVPGVKS